MTRQPETFNLTKTKAMKFKVVCAISALLSILLLQAATNPSTGPVHQSSSPRIEGYMADYLQDIRTRLTGAGSNTFATVAGTGGVTIASGKLKWSVTAVGGTCTINIGGAGAVTLPDGLTRDVTALPGWTTSQAVVVANGTGVAHWSHATPN